MFNFSKIIKHNQVKKTIFNFPYFSYIELNCYVKEVDKVLNHIYETIDEKELEITDNVSLVDGVLNISFKNSRNYVLNIQRPNLQIWLSSPISGPQRFEFDADKNAWLNIRNKKPLLEILEEEINTFIDINQKKLKLI
jgi:frataxin